MESISPDTIVYFVREPGDYRIGSCAFSLLRSWEWTSETGGIRKRLPQSFLSAHVNCTEINGEVAHSCQHGPCPHDIKVFILKKHNEKIWDSLLEQYPRPANNNALPFTKKNVEECVEIILDHLLSQKKHEAIHYSKNKNCYYITPKDLEVVKGGGASINTIRTRSKKINNLLREKMLLHPDWEQVEYSNFAAFRPKQK